MTPGHPYIESTTVLSDIALAQYIIILYSFFFWLNNVILHVFFCITGCDGVSLAAVYIPQSKQLNNSVLNH